MTTGERIAKKRHEKGWTQHELAKRMGLNSKSIKDWESGVSLPSAKNIIKTLFITQRICRLFVVPGQPRNTLSGRSFYR